MSNLRIDPPELRQRLVDRFNERAAGLGFAFPRRPARAEPLPEERVRYWAGQAEKALAEDRAAGIAEPARVEKVDSGKGYMIHYQYTTTPKAKPQARPAPPKTPRPAAAQGPDRDAIRSYALTRGLTELAAREYLEGVTE